MIVWEPYNVESAGDGDEYDDDDHTNNEVGDDDGMIMVTKILMVMLVMRNL